MEETKFCKYCETEKPITEFHVSNKIKCKQCILEYNKAYEKKRSEARKRMKDRSNENKSDELLYKHCPGCQQDKLIEAFGTIKTGRYIDRKERCSECENFKRRQSEKIKKEKREKKREADEEALMAVSYAERVKTIERRKLTNRLRTFYGIPVERYDEMLKQQNGLCAICHNSPGPLKKLVVDHDHATGYVRGLLCESCNFGLGQFRDNPTNLLNAVKYLKSSTWEY